MRPGSLLNPGSILTLDELFGLGSGYAYVKRGRFVVRRLTEPSTVILYEYISDDACKIIDAVRTDYEVLDLISSFIAKAQRLHNFYPLHFLAKEYPR